MEMCGRERQYFFFFYYFVIDAFSRCAAPRKRYFLLDLGYELHRNEQKELKRKNDYILSYRICAYFLLLRIGFDPGVPYLLMHAISIYTHM